VGANIITVTKNGQKAKIVESSLRVWKEKGWKVEDEKSTPKKSTAPSSGSND
jgi:hypothetical protein